MLRSSIELKTTTQPTPFLPASLAFGGPSCPTWLSPSSRTFDVKPSSSVASQRRPSNALSTYKSLPICFRSLGMNHALWSLPMASPFLHHRGVLSCQLLSGWSGPSFGQVISPHALVMLPLFIRWSHLTQCPGLLPQTAGFGLNLCPLLSSACTSVLLPGSQSTACLHSQSLSNFTLSCWHSRHPPVIERSEPDRISFHNPDDIGHFGCRVSGSTPYKKNSWARFNVSEHITNFAHRARIGLDLPSLIVITF